MHKTCLVLLAICLHANDIRISEVMSNPQGSEYENEFIEIFNATDHVMQINGWVLSDGNGVDTISHLSGPIWIQPSHYALIMDPGYDFLHGPYLDITNDSLPIYTISTDASFGSGGLSNGGESVIIRSPDSSRSSEMSWSSSTENGYSWERVSVTSADSLSSWLQSIDINGTPGYRNSVTPPLINLSLIGIEYESLLDSEPVEILLNIKNLGEYLVSEFDVSVYRDDNQNGEKDDDEWDLNVHFNSKLNSQEEHQIPLTLFPLVPGLHQLEARVLVENDEVAEDDSLRFEIIGSYPKDIISITEIMFSPSPDQQGEWIEIQNRSGVAVSLQGWTMSDANQTRHQISDTLLFIDAFDYLSLCASSNMANYFGLEPNEGLELNSWPALNTSSDSVRLFDASGHLVASAFYRGSWGESATSLERRHPDIYPHKERNWAASTQIDGGTPSGMNTRHLLPVEIRIDEIHIETPTPIGPTQAELIIEFQNLGIDTLYSLELESDADIYWYGALSSFGSDSLIFTSASLWPGYNEIPIRLIHEGDILADTSVQVVLGYSPGQIAINEIHYLPHEDQVEFLEFVNISSVEMDLKGWSFRDRSGSRGEVMSSFLIQPDSLFLWTGDANKLLDWTPAFAGICELSSWPSLNNSSDSIIILDPLGQRMLEHAYLTPSNDEPGKSLERLALWKDHALESSWAVCQDPLGITPGRQNSTQIPPHNLAVQGLAILDSILWKDTAFSVGISMVNTGVDLAEDAVLNINIRHNGTHVEGWSEILPAIDAGDNLAWNIELISETSGWISLEVVVQFEGDGIPVDNTQIHSLFISENTSPLVLNEIMPLPLSDQSEWIEIYNRSVESVDILGWLIADNSGSGISISDTNLLLEANGYLVIGSDQALSPDLHSGAYQGILHFPTLNNSEELITLFDPQGITMDEMSYSSSTELVLGRSLERIRPEVSGQYPGNWSVCIDDWGSTPGAVNSLYLDILSPELAIDLDPNPFTPDGDGYDDQLAIQYELPFEHGLMSVMVFDMAGRKIAEPVQIKPVGHRGQVLWDGEANYGGKAVTGLYIMKFLFDDQAGKVWSCLKKVYLIR
ncbi:MAG: lamin tail domain-containing protein [Candidatus Marinimicrobia bacterium]|nr:lamin tail domain-containing protein [Candidatus Neomarinimicrobiota bacterium]